MAAPGAVSPRSVAISAVIVVVSIVVAGCASWVSRGVWRSGEVVIPWGAVLAVAASGSWVLLARELGPGFALIAAVGWLVGVGFVVERSGDIVIANDGLGLGFLVAGTAAVLGGALVRSQRL